MTADELAQVERAEAALHRLGFGDLRVRHLGSKARVELQRQELPRARRQPLRSAIERELRAAGFTEVMLDPAGLRSGSLNEALTWGSEGAARWPGIAELPLAAGGGPQ